MNRFIRLRDPLLRKRETKKEREEIIENLSGGGGDGKSQRCEMVEEGSVVLV